MNSKRTRGEQLDKQNKSLTNFLNKDLLFSQNNKERLT